MSIRKNIENREKNYLANAACCSCNSKGRLNNELADEFRTNFQIDSERITKSKAFRRLMHKTQVFISPEDDHFVTRLTHTLEVSSISRTVARALNLNEDLTEAIALAHDLGHAPFGHAGENVLNNIVKGGFRHFEQSLRIVDVLENDGYGLNLTFEVRDGILNHTRGKEPITLEGKIVRFCDKVAYINHDVDDAIRASIIKKNDIPKEIFEFLGNDRTNWRKKMILSLIESIKNSNYKTVNMGNNQYIFDTFHNFMFEKVYLSDLKKEEKKVKYIIKFLFEYFMENIQILPTDIMKIAQKDGIERAICDYISGMTDKFAINFFKKVFIPKSFHFINSQS